MSNWQNPPADEAEIKETIIADNRHSTFMTVNSSDKQWALDNNDMLSKMGDNLVLKTNDEVPAGYVRLSCSCHPDQFEEVPLEVVQKKVESNRARANSNGVSDEVVAIMQAIAGMGGDVTAVDITDPDNPRTTTLNDLNSSRTIN